MPVLVPSSYGSEHLRARRLHEANPCHEPAGSPKGGQFCSKGGGLASTSSNAAATARGLEGFGVTRLAQQQLAMLEDRAKVRVDDPDVVAAREAIIAEATHELEVKHAHLLAMAAVQEIRAKKRERSTADRYRDPQTGDYTLERKAMHERIVTLVLAEFAARNGGAIPIAREPQAWLLAGLPGLGKSTVAGAIMNDPKNLHIDVDAMKGYIGKESPGDYNGFNSSVVQDEAGYLADLLSDRALALGVNVIIDGTLKSDGVGREHQGIRDGALGKIKDLQAHGYNVQVRLLDGTAEQSIERSVIRYVSVLEEFVKSGGKTTPPRYVPPSFIRSMITPDGSNKPRKVVDMLVEKGLVKNWGRFDWVGNCLAPPALCDSYDKKAASGR